jgi:UDPglucose 6-dehydrogenase
MNIGVIGVGVVGSAIKFGFERLGHDVFIHDVKYDTSILDVINTEVCYICVPTPSDKDGSCNIKIVEDVIDDLVKNSYNGIIAIKSTVIPGTTEKLISKYENLAFVPEFLRERCAISDFIQNHEVCVIGTHSQKIFEIIKSSHGNFPKEFVMCTPTEAEFSKYFHNVHNAMQIILANSFYEVCSKMGVNYENVKDSLKNRSNINFTYLNCNKNFRGFGGVCLPKDTAAMDYLCKKLNLDVEFFKNILDENSKYVTTVPNGMRI